MLGYSNMAQKLWKNKKRRKKSQNEVFNLPAPIWALILPEHKDDVNLIQHIWTGFCCRLQEGTACPENIAVMLTLCNR